MKQSAAELLGAAATLAASALLALAVDLPGDPVTVLGWCMATALIGVFIAIPMASHCAKPSEPLRKRAPSDPSDGG